MRRSLLAPLLLVALADAVAADDVVVLDAGQGEKRLLQLGAGTGLKQQATIVVDTVSSTSLMGRDVPTDPPPVTAGLDLTPRAADGGAYGVTFAYRDVVVGAGGDALGRMTAQKTADNLTGVSGSMRVSAGGRVSDLSTQGSGGDGFDLEIWMPRLPETPVGVGAVWTVSAEETDPKGLRWSEKTTWRLVSLEPGRATLAIETQRRAGAGTLALEGMKVPIQEIVETGTGTAVVVLGHAFPEAGAWHLDSTTSATMLGKPAVLTSRIDLRLGASK